MERIVGHMTVNHDLLPGVIEHDGMLWKACEGSTTSAEEFIAARTLFITLNEDSSWNPWVWEERRADFDRACEVMETWERAEPGHRRLTMKQWEAQQARREKARAAERQRDADRQERDKARYDEQRETDRLRLIEVQSRLDYEVRELAAYRDGTRFPAMDPSKRAVDIAKLESTIETRRADVADVAQAVGDPEDVVDQYGRLPRDRRERTWWDYRLDREQEVRRLKEEIPKLQAAHTAATDKAEKRERRSELDTASRRLDERLAEGPFTKDDMCSECATPMAFHGWVYPPGHPCPAWPGWAARMREARKMFEAAVERSRADAARPPVTKPEPLAVIPAGLPIADVIEKLTKLQQEFPEAEVRRGRANRWELWPRTGKD